jgi:hypothetical protein
MAQVMKKDSRGEWASLPVAVVYTKDFQELHRYNEFPSIYQKDLIRGHQMAQRPGESADAAKKRQADEFLALQNSPFFDIWASAMIDEILTGVRDRVTGVPRV